MERDVTLGPFFTFGIVLLTLAARRRSLPLAGVGVAAIVADQRLPFAVRLKERIMRAADKSIPKAPNQS